MWTISRPPHDITKVRHCLMILVDSTHILVRAVAVVTFKHRLTAAAGFVDRVF
jgi:hypothetical protein